MRTKYIASDFDRVPGGSGLLAQLSQLCNLTWDGDLIAKQDRTALVDKGYATQCCGFNIITPEGVKVLSDLNILRT